MSRQKIVVAVPEDVRRRLFGRESWARLHQYGDVTVNPAGGDLTAPHADVAGARILVTGWGTTRGGRPLLDLAPDLAAVIHSAGSVRSLVDDGVIARGVAVSSQAENNGLPVAEYTLAMILLSGKSVPAAQRAYRTRQGSLDTRRLLDGRGNYGLRVGIIGASRIGRRVLALLAPFDVRPLLHDPHTTPGEAAALGARAASLEEVMATCSVVSLHAPLLDGTKGMITAELLARLPDGATFINTARGALVDQEALTRELASGRIDAVLDVTEPEVPEAASPLWHLPNVVLTPHVAGSMGNEIRRLGDGTVSEVAHFAQGRPLDHLIAKSQLVSMA